eukprot:15118107-Alexandrium_andersonii.AAC.1
MLGHVCEGASTGALPVAQGLQQWVQRGVRRKQCLRVLDWALLAAAVQGRPPAGSTRGRHLAAGPRRRHARGVSRQGAERKAGSRRDCVLEPALA